MSPNGFYWSQTFLVCQWFALTSLTSWIFCIFHDVRCGLIRETEIPLSQYKKAQLFSVPFLGISDLSKILRGTLIFFFHQFFRIFPLKIILTLYSQMYVRMRIFQQIFLSKDFS